MSRKGDFIGVYNGGKFWPLDPQPEDVDMIAVAHALSQVCRFNGHTKVRWSIAQHSMLVEKILCSYLGCEHLYETRLLGLLHDASEAYISDLLSPFKKDVKGYKEIEAAIEKCILSYCKLDNITEESKQAVRQADIITLAVEASVLMKPDKDWDLLQIWKDEYTPFKKEIQVKNTLYTKGEFLMLCGALMESLDIDAPWGKEEWYLLAKTTGCVPLLGDTISYIEDNDDNSTLTLYETANSKGIKIPKDLFHHEGIEDIGKVCSFLNIAIEELTDAMSEIQIMGCNGQPNIFDSEFYSDIKNALAKLKNALS